MSKAMKIITVRQTAMPSAAKQHIHEYDPNDIDSVVKMMNDVAKDREAERKAMEARTRLRRIEQREMDVSRREEKVHRKEEYFNVECKALNTVLNVAAISLSLCCVVVAISILLIL